MFGDWVLRYEGTEYRFGPEAYEVQFVNLVASADSYRVDDAPMPRSDGTAFGRDFVEAGEITIDLIIDLSWRPEPAKERAARASAIWETLRRVWRADTLRDSPRAVAELIMGGSQMIEGRPRRITPDFDNQGRGVIKVRATFVPISTIIYDVDESGEATWHEQTVGLVPAQVGGLVGPLVAPLSTAIESSRARPFVVGGGGPVWPIITVRGPLGAGGAVELVAGWTVRLRHTLAYDDVVVIDTRPERSVMTYNGVPMNVLTPSSDRLSQLSIPPGPQEIALRGTSLEGTATASVAWREQKAGA